MAVYKSFFFLVGTEEQVEEVFRLRFLYRKPPSFIQRKLKLTKEQYRDLLIAATYWGLGFKDGYR